MKDLKKKIEQRIVLLDQKSDLLSEILSSTSFKKMSKEDIEALEILLTLIE